MPAALGIAASCLVLLRQTEFGPGLTPDSASFLSTAQSLFAGAGFVPFFGIYSYRPPFYPLILAATGFLQDDMIAAAGMLNAVAFGLSVFVAAAWLRRRHVSAALAAWAGLALALSPVAGVAAYVLAESLFVLFVLAALYFLDRFLVTGLRRALLVSAGFAALCCLTRYAGASVIVCATALIAARGEWRPTERFRAAALYLVVGTVPTALWLLRNLLVVDTLLGDRSHYQHFPALAVFHMVVETTLGATVGPSVLEWIERFSARLGVAAGAATKLVCLLALCALVAFPLARWRQAALGASAVLAGFVGCYLALLAAAAVWAGLDAEPRFAAPLVAPILLLCTLALHASVSRRGGSGLRRGPRWRRWLLAGAMATALSLWLAQWVAPNVAEVRQWRAHGGDGYGARRWAESATMASLRSGASDGVVLSNDPFAVFLLAGCGRVAACGQTIGPLRKRIAPQTDVVWFHAAPGANLMAFLGDFPQMRVIATHADGIVFRQGEKDGAVARLAEALLRDAREGGIVATSHFNVHLAGAGNQRLLYVKHNCEVADTRPRFFLHVTPSDPVDLPLGRTEGFRSPVSADFDNLDFHFAGSGVRHGRICVVSRALPSYAIAEIRTGQWSPSPPGEIWSTRFTVPAM